MFGKIKCEIIQVKFDDLVQAENHLGDIHSKIINDLDVLKQEIKKLNTMWQGPSHNLYVNRFNQEIESCRYISKEILRIQKYEESAQENYIKCEQTIENIINNQKIESASKGGAGGRHASNREEEHTHFLKENDNDRSN